MVNIIGDHATYHVQYDAPLTSDIEGLAAPVSHWVYTSRAPGDIARDTATAVAEAGCNRVASLILPADVSWGDNPDGDSVAPDRPGPNPVPGSRIDEAVAMLQSGASTMIVIGGTEITPEQALLLDRLSQGVGVRVCTDTFPTRVRRGAGTAKLEKLPYLAELAVDYLKDVENLILLGAKSPVSFFAYPNVPSVLSPGNCNELLLAVPGDDITAALQDLLSGVGGEGREAELQELSLPEPGVGDLSAETIGQSLACFMPEDAIVVDEGATSGIYCAIFSETARSHDWLNVTGGSIGFGLPAAVGAAIACPDRKVICLEGDGSAMYTIQALWTMARENLDVTVVIFNNRKYSILELEFSRTGARGGVPGPKAASTLDIGNPEMDFTAIAEGMGVSASRPTSAEEFNQQFTEAMAQKGPRLIDAVIPTVWS
jgi:acetolactate synthase-1/2/3 large subunit